MSAEFKMPFGQRKQNNRFKGMTLAAIAQADGGLVWLSEIADWCQVKAKDRWGAVGELIGAFLKQPEIAPVLERALAQAKELRRERAIARNREKADARDSDYRMRERAAEYGM